MSPRRDATLPIFELQDRLMDAARSHTRLVIRAPTGSGKSTQVPGMLLAADPADRGGGVVVLQPRRIAARMLAARVAQERGVPLGQEVGYQVRFDARCGPRTRICYVTEGVLLRRLRSDPDLTEVSTLVFDEFHERHLDADVGLAWALRLQRERRPDLRIVIMSATLKADALAERLQPAAALESEGRTFPVDIRYRSRAMGPRETLWDAAAEAFAEVAAEARGGHVLIFMPGAYEIQRTLGVLRDAAAARGFALCALHGELPAAEQDAAVAPGGPPRIIVATNVAETSLTIDGVRTVIDGGWARKASFDAGRGINTLLLERISRASADQRAGRAGRTAPGVCIRLWTEREHQARPLDEIPEIHRLDLAEAILSLRAAGVEDPRALPWLEPPPERSLVRAEGLLRDLDAIGEDGALTATGRRMAAFPTHPRYSRMLIEAGAHGAVRAAALCAALTQGRGLLVRRAGRDAESARGDALGEATSDFLILMRAWSYARRRNFSVEACRALGIHAQAARAVAPVYDALLRIAEREGLPMEETPPPDEAIARCLLAGFADQVARRLDGGTLRCEVAHGRRGRLDPDSAVRDASLLVAAEVREIEGKDREVVLSLATAIELDWLLELFPSAVRETVEVTWHRIEQRVVAECHLRYHDLSLDVRRLPNPPEAPAAALLAAEVGRGTVSLPGWNEAVERLVCRINFLAAAAPELGLGAIGPEERGEIITAACHGCMSQRDLRSAEVLPHVRARLSGAWAAALEREAPERVTLANGFTARVLYPEQGPPRFAARIQDLYGVRTLPRLACGRVAPALEILAPNQRPVQITQDLERFWTEHYPALRREYARRYPKHAWREPDDVDRPPERRIPGAAKGGGRRR
jgi:ATP-dependent helicase HrpB